MRLAMAAAVALLWQGAGVATPLSQQMRWQREIAARVVGGPVCAVLDAQVLAHAASRSGDDLRVFRETATGETEVPFALTESEAEPDDTAEATAFDARVQGDSIDFNLKMPRRVYSSVTLKIAAKDFVGSAVVTAKSGEALGSFAVFDLSGEGLARSTTLALAETMLPELYVSLRMRGPKVSADMVQGAEVPVSRESQALYTVVASTSAVETLQNGVQRMEMEVPAHVPVERVRFVLDPGFRGEFAREVSVGGDAGTGEERVGGSIWRVQRPGVAGQAAMKAEHLDVDAVLGLTLRARARVVVDVHDVALPPLPIREVRLEMRQRSVCFDQEAGARYWLRYGDAGLAAAVYKKQMAPMEDATMTMLGPETVNAAFHPEADRMRASQRRVGLAWAVWVGGLVLIWAGAGSLIRRRGRG